MASRCDRNRLYNVEEVFEQLHVETSDSSDDVFENVTRGLDLNTTITESFESDKRLKTMTFVYR